MRRAAPIICALLAGALIACSDNGSGSGSTATPDTTAAASSPSASATRASTPNASRTQTDQAVGFIDWQPCEAAPNDPGFECGTLSVPLDYSAPAARRVLLSIARHRARRPDTGLGSLFVNPGGPGASAVDMALNAEFAFPREIIDRFDIIGFDPRGVGKSEGIDCGDEEGDAYVDLDYSPETDRERDALVDYSKAYAAACFRMNGELLRHVGTLDAARDMESLREVLGAGEISYLGYSYGTLLGAAYADLYPNRVRAFILDGAIEPILTFDEREGDSAAAFERAFEAFFDDCSARRTCDFYSNGNPRAAYDDLLARLEEQPIPALSYTDTTVTADDARQAVTNALYDEASWPQLAFALVKADRDSDGTTLMDLAYPSSGGDDDDEPSHEGDANTAINCVDGRWPKDVEAYNVLEQRLQFETPRVGASSTYYNLPCAFWLADPAPLPLFDALGAPPILVISADGDPATPYAWGYSLAAQLSSGVLLTYLGFTHGTSFGGTSECIDQAALVYLIDLIAPPTGTYCGSNKRSIPLSAEADPTPTEAATPSPDVTSSPEATPSPTAEPPPSAE